MSKLGFRLVATAGTAKALANARIAVEHVRKVTEPGEGATVVDLVRRGHCDLVINTPFGDPGARSDGYLIREAALAARVPCITTMAGASGRGPGDRRRPGRPRALAPGAHQCAEENRLRVLANEAVGPYSLIRVERGGLEPGIPGQFFMLEAPGRLLPRPMSLCQAPPGELSFLLEAIGPGTRALAAAEPGDELHVFGPLGNGFRLDVQKPLLVGGGIGVAPFPYLSEQLGGPPAILGFRSDWHAEAAALVPNAEVVVEPTLVTEPLTDLVDCYKVFACGPEPMLEAVRELAPDAQLAWEAPMACGYGACYGCSVEIDGVLQRLCVAGPVLEAA